MNYATDGKCHNVEPGTYGHECGKPAAWIGEAGSGFRSGFFEDCKRDGYEARNMVLWEPRDPQHYCAQFRVLDC
jgi:hypothetical protein